MQASEARRAVAAAMSTASALDLTVDDAIVLNDSNRLVLRLMPCDVVARVAPMAYHASAETAVELAQRLAETDSPVAALEPRVEPLPRPGVWRLAFDGARNGSLMAVGV